MSGHVIRSFLGMPVTSITIVHQIRDKAFQIFENGRVGIFVNDQGRTGVVNEHITQPPVNSRDTNQATERRCDLIAATTGVSRWNDS